MKVNRMKLLTRRKVLLSGTIIGGFGLLAGFIYLGLKWTAISVVVTNIGESPIRAITVIQKVDGRSILWETLAISSRESREPSGFDQGLLGVLTCNSSILKGRR